VGGHERLHRDIATESESLGQGLTPDALELWREEFNRERPHRYAYRRESDRTLRDGSIEVGLFQALRATLRSDRPSGTEGKAPSAQQIVPSIP
jgi:hypothetical protein